MELLPTVFSRYKRIEVAYFDQTGKGFPKHSHNEFVIGANAIGREKVLLDRKCLDVSAGELTLYNPGEMQESYAPEGPWRFFSLYLSASAIGEFLGISSDVLFEKPVVRSPQVASELIAFCTRFIRGELQEDEITEACSGVLLGISKVAATSYRLPSTTAMPRLQTAREILLDNMSRPPSLQEVGVECELTPVQLVRAFEREFGLPPMRWLNEQRILRARDLLRSGWCLSKTAAALGFADQAHFTRRFKRVTGLTPGAFRVLK